MTSCVITAPKRSKSNELEVGLVCVCNVHLHPCACVYTVCVHAHQINMIDCINCMLFWNVRIRCTSIHMCRVYLILVVSTLYNYIS